MWFISCLSSAPDFVRSLLQTWVSSPLQQVQVGPEQALSFLPALNFLVCPNKMSAALSQPRPGGRLCQEGAPLTHVSTIGESDHLVGNLRSALKKEPEKALA